jgi:lipopolysaccharide export system protein LptA
LTPRGAGRRGKAGIAVMHDRRHPRSLLARVAVLAGGVVLLLALAPAACAQRVLNESLTSDGTSQPIQIFADQISTWTEADRNILLLKGNVVVTQGSTSIRTTDGVAWIDMSRYRTESVTYIAVYGENPISLERNQATVQADFGYVRLATTNKFDAKAFKDKIAKEDRTSDAVYQRALTSAPAELSLPMRKDSAAVRPMPMPPMGEGIRQAGQTQPAFPLSPPTPPMPDPSTPQPKQTTTYLQVPSEPGGPPGPGQPGIAPVPPPPVFSPFPGPPPSAGAPAKLPPQISIRPRYDGDIQVQYKPIDGGMTAAIITGGVTVFITVPGTKPGDKANSLDIEADRVVIWTKDNGQPLVGNVRSTQNVDNGAHEIYLAGHVEIRSRTLKELETLRADEVYYDVSRGVAVARKADLEIQSAKLTRPIRMVMEEFLQVNPKLYQMKQTAVFSSLLPSDPGLKVDISDVEIEERQVERTYLYFFPAYDKDGKRIVDTERIFTGRNLVTRLEGVPVFYFPYLKDNIERPLGPLDSVNVSYNTILGAQFYTTWDMFDLLNLHRPDGSRWKLFLDYLTLRGPGFGTEYELEGKNLFGVPSRYTGMVRLYGTFDHGLDVLGGNRGNVISYPDVFSPNPITHPDFRGQAYGKANVQDLPDGFSVLGQFSFLSDRNYLEQYFLNTHLNELNQDTYLQVKQQQGNWAWTLQGQVGTRDWMTETTWLPKADGYLLGQTFLDDMLVYNGHASAGYARLRPTLQVPFAYLPTDVRTDALRADLMQEVSLPFCLGPVKVAPYGKLDTAYYSQDVNGDSRGRLLGGGGVRWNMPLSRVFPDVQSELLNLNGIYHKINLTGNYYTAQSSSSVNNFPQFDRLNDDSTDQALRDIRPFQAVLNPAYAKFLTTSNLFNPQNYAIRRLIDSNVDTLDSIDVLQLAINQRWQTKRGFPGNEHVVDWMTLNLGVSVFPHSVRDNFGHTFGILEYDYTWNVGERTALTSSGWFEPFAGGPRVFDFGAIINRPDTTSFYLGYKQIDPINSKAVIASAVYPFSAKYAVTASTVWDFGNHVSSYSLFISRMGTDVMINFGLSYNSTLSTFSIAFEILPNLARTQGRSAGLFPAPLLNIDPLVNQR